MGGINLLLDHYNSILIYIVNFIIVKKCFSSSISLELRFTNFIYCFVLNNVSIGCFPRQNNYFKYVFNQLPGINRCKHKRSQDFTPTSYTEETGVYFNDLVDNNLKTSYAANNPAYDSSGDK